MTHSLTPLNLMRALSDETRMRILALLAEHDELCVCDLTQALDMPQPKVSRHLAVLREAAILLDRRDGQWIHYRLHPALPRWAGTVVRSLLPVASTDEPFVSDRFRLGDPGERARRVCL
jgi:ArsR family transcriptional regulator